MTLSAVPLEGTIKTVGTVRSLPTSLTCDDSYESGISSHFVTFS